MKTKEAHLASHINIGSGTAAKLVAVGIDSFEKLKAAGTEVAFIKLQAMDPGACLSLLYGLDGAIQGIKWNLLPPERKQQLKEFHKSTQKRMAG